MFVVPTLLDRSGYFLVSFLIVNHRATRTEKTWLNRISATRLCLSLKHVMNKIIWYNVIMTRSFHHSFTWLLVALTDFFCFVLVFFCFFVFFLPQLQKWLDYRDYVVIWLLLTHSSRLALCILSSPNMSSVLFLLTLPLVNHTLRSREYRKWSPTKCKMYREQYGEYAYWCKG